MDDSAIEQGNPQTEQELLEEWIKQLNQARVWESIQFQVVNTLANTTTWHGALKGILRSIGASLAAERGKTWGAFWCNDKDRKTLNCACHIDFPSGSLEAFSDESSSLELRRGSGIPGKVWSSMKAICIDDLSQFGDFPRQTSAAQAGLNNGIVFPVRDKDKFLGVFEFFTEKPGTWNIPILESLGRQIGQFISRREADNSREHLANIVENSSDAIILLSAEGKIIGWNHGAEKTFSYRPAEIIGKDLSVLIPGDNDAELGRLLRATLNSRERVEGYETSLLSMSGRGVDVVVYTIPWFTDGGKYDGCSLTMHNITERKEAERRVGEFYSIVSHELRTPLTSIRGVLGLIESGTVEPGTEECAELITVARSSADRLIRLINDMLDLKKIESGKMELRKSKIEVEELLACSLSSLQGLSEEYGVSIRKCGDNFNELYINADWDKVTQVITNLVSNAVKFSPTGGEVIIRAEVVQNQRLRIRIIDNGPGIAPEDLKKLFDKFQQLDSSDTRKVGGTGLGLAISKALVEEHDGTIGVISELSRGSEFWFEIPLLPANNSSALLSNHYDLQSASLKSRRVLIVDDNEELRKVLVAQLSGIGMKCSDVGSGTEALELLHSNAFDILILDVLMPNLDGFEVVSALKRSNSTKRIPLLIYSCEDLSSSKKERLTLGLTRFLVKGETTQRVLEETLCELLESPEYDSSNFEPEPQDISVTINQGR